MAKTKKVVKTAAKKSPKKATAVKSKVTKTKASKASVEIEELVATKVKKKPKQREIDNARKGDSEKLCQVVVEGMKEKKATDIVIIDLRNLKNAIADFFIVCSGNSDRQLEAITESIDEQVFKTLGENPWHSEGKNNKEWMLLDYITVVAHVFKNDRRQYYALEKLWGDAEITEVED